MEIKKHTEKVYIKQIVQYATLEEFLVDYKRRIETGWKITEPYYSNVLAFAYEKFGEENVLFCEPFN